MALTFDLSALTPSAPDHVPHAVHTADLVLNFFFGLFCSSLLQYLVMLLLCGGSNDHVVSYDVKTLNVSKSLTVALLENLACRLDTKRKVFKLVSPPWSVKCAEQR